MKYLIQIFILVLALTAQSCGGDKPSRPAPAVSAEKVAQQNAQIDIPEIPSGAIAGKVWHYTCPNGHDGADGQGTCLVCGSTLEHNDAFHNTPSASPTPTAEGGEPPQNAAGVWHYTCPNGHDGGAGSATACAVCGTTLVHNSEYHNSGGGSTIPSDPLTTTTTTPTSVPPTTTSEPPQNDAGVWHYTCPNGHDGGAGSATACSECGATLVHNTLYHN